MPRRCATIIRGSVGEVEGKDLIWNIDLELIRFNVFFYHVCVSFFLSPFSPHLSICLPYLVYIQSFRQVHPSFLPAPRE